MSQERPGHLNFCRQMVKQFNHYMSTVTLEPSVVAMMRHCIGLAGRAQKFILPDGGRLYDDPEFRALDDTVPLSLPFPLVAIEFTRSHAYVANHAHRVDRNSQPTKALMFARELPDCIAITVVVWVDFAGVWAPYPEVAIPRTNYLNRSQRINGYTPIAVYQNPEASYIEHHGRRIEIPISDYMDEIGALLCLLNVLQCGNVHIERSNSTAKAAAGSKGRLPFDSYHVLTIDVPGGKATGSAGHGGAHRSPREHLRRGHIRRLQDGRKIWVNATIVNAGIGNTVTKDYKLKAAA